MRENTMLEEINIGPYPGRSSQTQEGHALSTAKKMIKGATFYCNRIKAEVGARSCKSKYTYAKAQKIQGSPCLECAKVLAMLRNDPSVDPQPTINPKEIAAMSRPAKKGTPDSIVQEVKLEIVETHARETKPLVSQNKEDLSDKNPFAGWTKYDPLAGRRAASLEFVSISRTAISFSAAATTRLDLKKYPTVTFYYQKDRIGVELCEGVDGVLKCTNETKGRTGVKIAAQGLIKALGLDAEKMKGRRYELRELGGGLLEIDLTKEVKAA